MKIKFCSFFLVAATLLLTSQAYAEVLVIANNSVKSTTVAKSDLKDVLSGGSSSLKDGSKVTPILLKSGSANDQFLAEYIGKNDAAFRATWRSLVFSGQASMPKSLDSEAAVVDYVAHNAGAVGYISAATPHDGVKVLAVR